MISVAHYSFANLMVGSFFAAFLLSWPFMMCSLSFGLLIGCQPKGGRVEA